MACQGCGIETRATHCQVCQYLEEMTPPVLPAFCRHCQAPIADPAATGSLCRLCRDLFRAVKGNPWLALAHAEWEQENFQLAKRKRDLL